MNKFSLDKGRVNQKIKTRTRILDAAKILMSKDKKVTLEEVADKAKVGRATIYRYFPNIELLFSEASLDIHFMTPEELFKKTEGMPLGKRILFVQDYYNKMAQDHEIIFRRYLSTTLIESIGSGQRIRGARRVETMDLILQSEAKHLSDRDKEKLKNVATVLMGIESVIVTKDVCALSNEESRETLNWAIETILKGLDYKE